MPSTARSSTGDAHNAVLLATPDRQLSRTLSAELVGLDQWWCLKVQSVAGAHRILAEQGPGALAIVDCALDDGGGPRATVGLVHALRRHGWNDVLIIGNGVGLDGISAVLSSGAHGYLVAGERARTRLTGQRLPCRPVALGSSGPGSTATDSGSMPRGFEVVELAARGYNNREIGHALGVSAETVKSHLVRLSRRFGARDRAHLVLLVMRMGVFP